MLRPAQGPFGRAAGLCRPPSYPEYSWPFPVGARFFLESMFIDQATLKSTRPNSPSGVEPARPLVGRYFKVQFREWGRLPRICSLLGWVVGPQSHQ